MYKNLFNVDYGFPSCFFNIFPILARSKILGMFSKEDIEFIEQRGQNLEQISIQIERFTNGFPFVNLDSPATPGNGIEVFGSEKTEELCRFYENESVQLKVLKFVPASGAATRMFKTLFEFLGWYDGSETAIIRYEKDTGFNGVKTFIDSLPKFAFYDELKTIMAAAGVPLEDAIAGRRYDAVVRCVLEESGMSYGSLPKGLLAFHRYGHEYRTAFEEHLIEGLNYAKNAAGEVFLHFTVSPEHRNRFESLANKAAENYGRLFGVRFHIDFSEQKPSTDTIAVDLNNQVFRNDDGSLLFRPAGHGALIENLNALDADVVFVKNIDNIVPDRLKDVTYTCKKALGGYLLKLQQRVHYWLKKIETSVLTEDELSDLLVFCTQTLHIDKPDVVENTKAYFLSVLNRPIRVCGMVKNEGEPGGGPFWVKSESGRVSLQIVESSQVNLFNKSQAACMQTATHFNPVDLVCAIRDYKGRPFDLTRFVDPSTGFISEKSKDGRQLRAMELPGLWNGAMADWITVFVETPIETFNPVKTINDLLREQHQ